MADIKDALSKVVKGIQSGEQSPVAVFNAHIERIKGIHCQANIRQFEVQIDEPEFLGGSDVAPNPVELMLAALGGCQEILYTAYASMMGIALDNVKVHASGKLDLRGLLALDETVPAGFTEVHYETTLVSNEPKEKLDQLIAMVEGHCPVMDTLKRPIPVSGKVHVHKFAAVTV